MFVDRFFFERQVSESDRSYSAFTHDRFHDRTFVVDYTEEKKEI